MESLMIYLVAAMVAWVPVYVHKGVEPLEDTQARYASIARDAAAVAFESDEEPLFGGPDGRAQTALLMLAVASYESSFRKAVDSGARLGDGGRSYCLMQMRVGAGTTREGWTGLQLVAERKLCFRSALHMLHSSFNACRAQSVEDRLAAYATGHCYAEAEVSRSRVLRAKSWWQTHALPRPLGSEVEASR